MSPLAWDQTFNVGHREIDRQHKELLAFLNEVESLLLTSESYSIMARLNLLERLLIFVEQHFKLERAVMQNDENSDTAVYDHWRSQKSFDAKIYTLYRDLLAKRLVLDSDIRNMIRDEFHYHISKGKNLLPQEVFRQLPRLTNQMSDFHLHHPAGQEIGPRNQHLRHDKQPDPVGFYKQFCCFR